MDWLAGPASGRYAFESPYDHSHAYGGHLEQLFALWSCKVFNGVAVVVGK